MKVCTSSFDNTSDLSSDSFVLVNIAGKNSNWAGLSFPRFAPLRRWWEVWHKYVKAHPQEYAQYCASLWYIEQFNKTVLAKVSPADFVNFYKDTIGKSNKTMVLLCFEKSGEFCHRRLVAKWLEQRLGIVVPELLIL